MSDCNQIGYPNLKVRTRRQREATELDGEQLSYELFECDARSGEEQMRDSLRGTLAGDLIVIIPGHGQTADSTIELIQNTACRSKSRLAWSIDIDPPKGGDLVKAKALPIIARRHLLPMFPPATQTEVRMPQTTVTLVGWSHGGSEALRTAETDPQLISCVIGLCPTGLIQRAVLELLFSFLIESIHVFLLAILSRNLPYFKCVLGIGANIVAGVLGDVRRTHSPARAWKDIRWAARKVPGADYRYTGSIVLLFGKDDKVIRWQDVFPGCKNVGEIDGCVSRLRMEDFPCVNELRAQALDGNHLSPETDPAFAIMALRYAGQLEEV